MSDTRPIWLTASQRQVIESINEYGQFSVLHMICDAWDAAPADAAGPHGVVRVAITNAYYDARNAGETMETAADNARDAVLRALGRPDD